MRRNPWLYVVAVIPAGAFFGLSWKLLQIDPLYSATALFVAAVLAAVLYWMVVRRPRE